jgi:CBS domain-containing protein
MSRQPVWVTPETDVVSAATRMSEHELGALPVLDRGRLVGIITAHDIACRYLTTRAHEGRLVGHYMTRNPITIEPEQSLEQAEALMAQHHIRRLPVCERGRLVGMLARGDLDRHLSPDGAEQVVSV